MAKIVVLSSFNAQTSSGARIFLPGEIVDSAQWSAADYTAITNAAPAKYTTSFDAPAPALVTAQSQAVALRAAGGDAYNATEGIMYRAMF